MNRSKAYSATAGGTATPAQRLPALALGRDGPVFDAPWQAQAFAMVHLLHERGAFTWGEWADVMANAIQDAQDAGDLDRGDTYYNHWLTALERIVALKQIVTKGLLLAREEEWRSAALATPHGHAIVLPT
jgi:nitrile hydratase accessory protein